MNTQNQSAPTVQRLDLPAIRKRLGLSQNEFSARFGIPAGTLRDWEQNRRRPEGPARALLIVIDKEPDAVKRALEPLRRPVKRQAATRP